MSAKGAWTQLGKDKLLSSDITSAQGTALGMYEVPSAAMLDKSLEARPALVIPYMGLDGKPMAAHPKWPNFYRVRYLDAPKIDFKAAAGEKAQRYAQPPGSGVCAYFPNSVNWTKLAKDTDYDLIITEGELKAAAASAKGFPTIGLGGVWNFRSSKEGVWLLPELAGIAWARRTVFVCFDSDYVSKSGVCQAINALCEELQERGATVKLLALPEGPEGEKVGLDDYLLAHTEGELTDLLDSAEHIGISRALWSINDDVVYIDNPGLVLTLDGYQKLDAGKFKNESKWATASATETKVNAKGDLVREKVPAAPMWIRWPLRRSAKKLTYAPGEPQLTPEGYLNQWPGWGLVPVKGDVTPWVKLTKFLFASAEPGMLDWFYDWCAYPIQNPGVKMFSAVVIHGTAQGTGKTLVGYTLGRIYGANYKEITDNDLEETYWAENKQFILGDEVSGKDNRQYMNTLKRLITKETIDINIKFVPQYELPNCMNFLFTSQHGDSFFLEDKDRRFFINEVQDDPMPLEFYRGYDHWYKNGGCAHLMQWLLERKISKTFNPAAPAPRTAAKERMIAATKGDAGSWAYELKSYPDQALRQGKMRFTRDIFSARELLIMYEQDHPNSKMTAVGLGRQLSTAGFQQIMGGRSILNPNSGRHERLFAVRNTAVWNRCRDLKLITRELNKPPVQETKK